MREERDEMIERIVDELKVLPAVPADAAARVLARVDAARRSGGANEYASDDDVTFFPTSTDEMPAAPAGGSRSAGGFRRRFVVSLPAAIGYALAATLAGFLIRGALPRAPRSVASVPSAVGETLGAGPRVTTVAATRRDLQEAPAKVQFVLDARRARSVSVVGDFNAWDAAAAPLARDSITGVWSGVVDVTPGRHVYAFLVDGTVWTLDPRAPRAKDSDYGTEQSVLIVGLP